ncbi:restriction endonuclease subunit S, partial [Gluconacetobacter entanii]
MSIEDTTLPFKLPADWRSTFVGNEFFLTLGKMLDADKNVGVPKPYLGNKSVRWGRIDINDLSLIKLTPSDLHRYRLADGDLLVCEGGDVGRSAIWSGQLEECYFQKALHRVRSRGGYSAVLLRYLLEFYSKTGFLLNFATQTSIAHLPKDKFEVMPLPKPSMGEQKAIAGALSDADTLIDELERLIAKKRLIKQGAIQELLTGRRRLPGFSDSWVKKVLPELAEIRSGGTPSTTNSELWDGDIAWCTPTDITALKGNRFLSQTSRYITELGLRKSAAELLPAGTIVMTSRATIGECAIAMIPMSTNQGFKNFISRPGIDRDFLFYLLSAQKIGFIELCSGSTFLEIGMSQLRKYHVRVPSNTRACRQLSRMMIEANCTAARKVDFSL